MRSFYHLMGVPPAGFDLEHRFVTSWLVSPLTLACLRLIFALFGWANLFASWAWAGIHDDSDDIGRQFSYFTNLTWWGITTYTTIASAHTFVYTYKGRSWLEAWGRPLQLLHSLFYTSIVTLPILVTIVFWVVLYDGTWFPVTFDAFSNVSRHGLNSLIALVEIILPATNPPPFLHIPFIWIILLLYLALAYLTYATQRFYTYDFLDPRKGAGRVTGYAFGIAAAILIIFLVVWVLIWVRRRFTGTGKPSRRAAVPTTEIIEQDVQVHRKEMRLGQSNV